MKKSVLYCALVCATLAMSCAKHPIWTSPSKIELKDGTKFHCDKGLYITSGTEMGVPAKVYCQSDQSISIEGSIILDWKNVISLKRIVEDQK